MVMFRLLIMLLIFWAIPCGATECLKEAIIKTYTPKYAKHFKVYHYNHFIRLEVDKYQFIITSNSNLNCSDVSSRIQLPVTRVGLTSTTYLPSLTFFKKQDTLKAFQGKKYIVSNLYNKKQIEELSFKLNTEKLVSLKLDLIMAYESNLNSQNDFELFKKLNVPVVINKDFEETSPLARAEWIVFNAYFFGLEQAAVKYFSSIEENYLKLKDQNKKSSSHPTVLVGNIQNGFWMSCGGTSDLAQMIEDAGAHLAFKNDRPSTQQISLENFVTNKTQYDFWLPHNDWRNHSDLIEAFKKDPRYKFIDARKIFNNTLVLNKDSFNDYWEEGMQRPDIVLSDLSAVFHPENFKNYKMRWYKPL